MRCECCDDCTDRHSQIVKNLVSNGRFTLSWATRAGFINLFFFQLQHGFVCHFVIYKNHECWCRANRGPNKRQSCILQCAQTKNRLKKKTCQISVLSITSIRMSTWFCHYQDFMFSQTIQSISLRPLSLTLCSIAHRTSNSLCIRIAHATNLIPPQNPTIQMLKTLSS